MTPDSFFSDFLSEMEDSSMPLLASRLTVLSSLGADEIARFRGAWDHTEVRRRRQIARWLVELAEDNIELDFDAVFMAVLKDEDAEVRFTAIQGLWEYEGRDLISSLIDMLQQDPDTAVRAQAALALGSFVMKAEFERLSDSDSRRVERALQAVIENPEEKVEVRARALESAGARSVPWVRRSIEEAYRDSNHRMRVSAVHAMGRHCDPRWAPILIQELSSDDPEMRYEAANACAFVCGETAVPELISLTEDEDAEVQEAAVTALGEIGGDQAKAALKRLTRHPEGRVRDAAASALEQIDFDEDPLGFNFS
ncbi:MAG: HEAT repeat domain-containing protein [Dehalococcoidia bacterium]|nr:HEAT repeat domain-containing protein [Dehalococcoidia bacterium]